MHLRESAASFYCNFLYISRASSSILSTAVFSASVFQSLFAFTAYSSRPIHAMKYAASSAAFGVEPATLT